MIELDMIGSAERIRVQKGYASPLRCVCSRPRAAASQSGSPVGLLDLIGSVALRFQWAPPANNCRLEAQLALSLSESELQQVLGGPPKLATNHTIKRLSAMHIEGKTPSATCCRPAVAGLPRGALGGAFERAEPSEASCLKLAKLGQVNDLGVGWRFAEVSAQPARASSSEQAAPD